MNVVQQNEKKRNKLSACVKKKEFVAVMYQRIRDDFLYIYIQNQMIRTNEN